MRLQKNISNVWVIERLEKSDESLIQHEFTFKVTFSLPSYPHYLCLDGFGLHKVFFDRTQNQEIVL